MIFINSSFPRGLGATVEALRLKVMANECIQIILISLITSETFDGHKEDFANIVLTWSAN